jgi:hypothetical protein
MNPPLVSFNVKEKYLLVTGHGKRDNLAMMVEAATQIYEKILETNRHYLLIDYRNLEINVNMGEAFNIVRRYETNQPELKNAVVAAVFGSQGLAFGNYWKDIAEKRGFFFKIFQDIDLAEAWLLKQIR